MMISINVKSDFDLRHFNMAVNLTITYSNSFHSLFIKKKTGDKCATNKHQLL